MTLDVGNLLFKLGIAVLLFLALAWYVRGVDKRAKSEQRTEDKAAGASLRADIVETSDDAAAKADSRSEPALHDSPGLVRADTLPDWTRRGQ